MKILVTKRMLRKKYKKPTVNVINTEKINGLYSHNGTDGAGYSPDSSAFPS